MQCGILQNKSRLGNVIASLQQPLEAMVAVETVNVLRYTFMTANALWLVQPEKYAF